MSQRESQARDAEKERRGTAKRKGGEGELRREGKFTITRCIFPLPLLPAPTLFLSAAAFFEVAPALAGSLSSTLKAASVDGSHIACDTIHAASRSGRAEPTIATAATFSAVSWPAVHHLSL